MACKRGQGWAGEDDQGAEEEGSDAGFPTGDTLLLYSQAASKKEEKR